MAGLGWLDWWVSLVSWAGEPVEVLCCPFVGGHIRWLVEPLRFVRLWILFFIFRFLVSGLCLCRSIYARLHYSFAFLEFALASSFVCIAILFAPRLLVSRSQSCREYPCGQFGACQALCRPGLTIHYWVANSCIVAPIHNPTIHAKPKMLSRTNIVALVAFATLGQALTIDPSSVPISIRGKDFNVETYAYVHV